MLVVFDASSSLVSSSNKRSQNQFQFQGKRLDGAKGDLIDLIMKTSRLQKTGKREMNETRRQETVKEKEKERKRKRKRERLVAEAMSRVLFVAEVEMSK
jgi:hypothetical protein